MNIWTLIAIEYIFLLTGLNQLVTIELTPCMLVAIKLFRVSSSKTRGLDGMFRFAIIRGIARIISVKIYPGLLSDFLAPNKTNNNVKTYTWTRVGRSIPMKLNRLGCFVSTRKITAAIRIINNVLYVHFLTDTSTMDKRSAPAVSLEPSLLTKTKSLEYWVLRIESR